MRRSFTLVVGCALLVSACSLPTLNLLGAKTGDTELTAVFDDTQDIVVGHTVQISNVKVGSVIKVEVVSCTADASGTEKCGPPTGEPDSTYKSKLTLSIGGGRVPVGTSARVHRTSILGEHFVDLEFPSAGSWDAEKGPFLSDGGAIEETSADPDFEDLALKAGEVVAAVTADDLSSTIDALAKGLGGKGPELKELVVTLSNVAGALDAESPQLVAAVDALGRLGQTLAPASDTIGALIDDLADASVSINLNRDRIFQALSALSDLSQTTNDVVLVPHAERLKTLVSQLADVSGVLRDNTGKLESLLIGLNTFTGRIDNAIKNGNLLLFAWFDLDTISNP